MGEANDGGWTFVARGRRRRPAVLKCAGPGGVEAITSTPRLKAQCLEEVVRFTSDLRESAYWKSTEQILQSSAVPHGIACACYGLGSLLSSRVARHQFALLILMRDLLQPKGAPAVFDPILEPWEQDFLSNHGMRFAPAGQDELSQLPPTTAVFLFMPHCDRALYDDVVRRRAASLHATWVLGNSFMAYADTPATCATPHLDAVCETVVETPIPDTFPAQGVFNNTSLHQWEGEPAGRQGSRGGPGMAAVPLLSSRAAPG